MKDVIKYLNESPTIFFILQKKEDWVLEYVTENVYKLFGYNAQEYMSNKIHITDSIHEDDVELFKQEARNLTKNNDSEFQFESYRIVVNSKIYWVQHNSKIIRDENGNATHVYGYLTDITRQKELYNQLNVTKNIIETIFEHSTHSIILLSTDGAVVKVNKAALSIIDKDFMDVAGKKYWMCDWWSHAKTSQDKIKEDFKEALEGIFVKKLKFQYDPEGVKKYIDFSMTPVYDQDDEIIYILVEGNDITKSVKASKKMQQYVDIINDNVYISVSDLEGHLIDCSNAFCTLHGCKKEDIVGERMNIFRHPDMPALYFEEMWSTINEKEVWKGEHKNLTMNGKTIHVETVITPNLDEDGNVKAYTAIYKDVTDKKEIQELLITDYLTKIYNRRYFNTVFENEYQRCKRHKLGFVLMIMDIDYFKQYNDTYGHQEGDNVLISVAKCLDHTLHRPEDFAFRLGGEEFGVVTSDISKEGAEKLAQKFQENIKALGIEHKASLVNEKLTLSIGIKYIKADEEFEVDEIYKLADDALYSAKKEGRNCIRF